MKNNTKDTKKMLYSRKFFLLIICLVIGAAVVTIHVWNQHRTDNMIALQLTYQVEDMLIEVHQEEVISVVENIQSQLVSLESIQNPDILSEFVVTPYLEHLSHSIPEKGRICSSSECTIFNSVNISKVRILEYSPERFKAIGCGTAYMEVVTPGGEFIRSLDPREFRTLYVFVSVDNTWKLAGSFNITDQKDAYRNWDYAPAWLKQVVGDLPHSFDCETPSYE
jgi:hypothetical protein